jgi:hypothetical protein
VADTDDISPNVEPPSPSDAALSSLAKSEDVTSYVETRREDEGLEPEAAPEDRQSRIDEALARAPQDTRQAREQSNGLDGELAATEQAYHAAQWEEAQNQQRWQAELNYARAQGQAAARAQQLKQVNPAAHKTITDNLLKLDNLLNSEQQQALYAALAYFPDSTWRMALNLEDDAGDFGYGPSKLEKLAALSDASPAQIWQAAAQGTQQLGLEAYVNARIMLDRVVNGRRISNAPPPFLTPRGGAGPPRDIARLALKENASDYIRARMAQERRRE